MTLDEAEVILDAQLPYGWEVEPYLSPAEKAINKPILPKTDPSTNRMGHVRNWPGPDTALVEAVFIDYQGNFHTSVHTSIQDSIEWLLRQNAETGMVIW